MPLNSALQAFKSSQGSRSYSALLILVISGLMYGFLAHRHDVGIFNDDAMYVLTACTLLKGHYLDPTQVDQPPEIHFLPGFPALLAPLTAVIHKDWNKLKVIPWFLALLGSFLAWTLYRHWFSPPYALMALSLFVFNPLVIFLSDILLSEWLILCLSLGALILILKIDHHPRKRDQLILAVVLSWAALARPEGILLCLALGSALFIKSKSFMSYRWAILTPITVLSAWLVRNFFLSGLFSTYASIWQPPNLTHLMKTIGSLTRIIFGAPTFPLGVLFVPGVGSLILTAGLWNEFHRDTKLNVWQITLGIYLLLFIGVRLFWSVFDDRFFLPILPFLSALTISGCTVFKRNDAIGRGLMGVLALNLVLQNVTSAASLMPQRFDVIPRHSLDFIRNNIPSESTFLTNKGGLLRLYAGHCTNGTIQARSPEALAYQLHSSGTRYIWIRRQPIADLHIQRQWMKIDKWISTWPEAFPVIFNEPQERSTIYAVRLPASFIAAYEAYRNAHIEFEHSHVLKASDLFKQALNRYPDFPDALNDYAGTLIEQKDYDRALTHLHTALRRRPDFGLAKLNIARIYELKKMPDLACQAIHSAALAAAETEDLALQDLIKEESQHSNTMKGCI
jgi:hypothetical protein